MQYTTKNTEPNLIALSDVVAPEDYGLFLKGQGVNYDSIDPYLHVGKISRVQGWLLHLSVVITQVEQLIKTITPILLSAEIPFKIPMDRLASNDILLGYLGKASIGKVVTIYPGTDEEALDLAKRLIKLTASFTGPKVPTDICLGNIVYTRYGSFNAVKIPDKNGKDENYIYNSNKELVKDNYSIPFRLPDGVFW